MMKIYYHFVRSNKRLGYNDGRKVILGKTYKVDGPIRMCVHGLHASKHVCQALSYAPGSILCKVILGSNVIHAEDKCVSDERRVVAMLDATDILDVFARQRALDLIAQAKLAIPDDAMDFLINSGPAMQRIRTRQYFSGMPWYPENKDVLAKRAAFYACDQYPHLAAKYVSSDGTAHHRNASRRLLNEMIKEANWKIAKGVTL